MARKVGIGLPGIGHAYPKGVGPIAPAGYAFVYAFDQTVGSYQKVYARNSLGLYEPVVARLPS